MRILPFDCYGVLSSQSVSGEHPQKLPIGERIAEEIAKNEALRAALLAIADQEREQSQKRRSFKVLSRRQARILLSQLRNVNLDFHRLKQHPEGGRGSKHKPKFICSKKKRNIRIGASASMAIANAAEAWVMARNRGILDVASVLFLSKDQSID